MSGGGGGDTDIIGVMTVVERQEAWQGDYADITKVMTALSAARVLYRSPAYYIFVDVKLFGLSTGVEKRHRATRCLVRATCRLVRAFDLPCIVYSMVVNTRRLMDTKINICGGQIRHQACL